MLVPLYSRLSTHNDIALLRCSAARPCMGDHRVLHAGALAQPAQHTQRQCITALFSRKVTLPLHACALLPLPSEQQRTSSACQPAPSMLQRLNLHTSVTLTWVRRCFIIHSCIKGSRGNRAYQSRMLWLSWTAVLPGYTPAPYQCATFNLSLCCQLVERQWNLRPEPFSDSLGPAGRFLAACQLT
jgi:hypothetical protein